MRVICGIMVAVLMVFSAQAAEIEAESLKLTVEQNQKLTELKNNLKAEVEPILAEIKSKREQVTEIEKKYFEEFWNMLTEEQREAFSKQYK